MRVDHGQAVEKRFKSPELGANQAKTLFNNLPA
ncbi:MAG: hypothetical protein RI964_2857 [Pseudomonadota bacterium]|jgi:hypothetical protein